MAQISSKFRIAFILFNILYAVMGISMIAVGAAFIVRLAMYGFFTENLYNAGGGLFIAAGALKIVVGIWGTLSYIAKKKIIFAAYTLAVIILMMVTFAAAIYGFLRRDTVYDISTDRLQTAFMDENFATYQVDIMTLQEDFNCCGVNDTFTPSAQNPCNSTRDIVNTIEVIGCLPYLTQYVTFQLYYIGAIGMGFAAFEGTALIVAMQNLEGLV